MPAAIRSQLPEFFRDPWSGQQFQNTWPHPALPRLRDVLRWKLRENTLRRKGYRPHRIAGPSDGLSELSALSGDSRLFWIGHASFLLEMDGVRLVLDPIFGRAAVVTPRVTPAAAGPQQLGKLDAVLVTHGHHDHLDPGSLAALARQNQGRTLFVVPRGLKAARPRECTNVVELSWWQYVQLGPARVHLVPAQHWHQRTALDRDQRLWGGFVVEGTHRIYHSGDTGFFPGFAAIGKVFGGIDAACLPLGAYEPTWFMGAQHMSPPQSLEAYHQLAASHFVGMHWGAFDLSDEELDAGPRWLYQAIEQQQLPAERFHILAPGGSVTLSGARGQTRAATKHPYHPER